MQRGSIAQHSLCRTAATFRFTLLVAPKMPPSGVIA